MIPRGKLDIGFADILAGFYYYYFSGQLKSPDDEHLSVTCLSVRTAFDLILSSLSLPAGSQVLIMDVNIPGMFQIIAEHQLTAVTIPINRNNLTINPDHLEQLTSPFTKVIVITHLFGSIIDVGPVVKFAKEKGLIVIEDCAQAFNGVYKGHPGTDVAMFSFGMIKTNTALTGAIACFNNEEIYRKVNLLNQKLPQQPEKVFFIKLLTALAIKLLCLKLPYTIFFNCLTAIGKDPDMVLTSFTRGFPSGDLLKKIRHKLSKPSALLLGRKLKKFDIGKISARANFGWEILNSIPAAMKVGGASITHTFWVLPIETKKAEQLVIKLRSAGFDATVRASSLVKQNNKNVKADDFSELRLNELVYLPLSPKMDEKSKRKLKEILNRHAVECI